MKASTRKNPVVIFMYYQYATIYLPSDQAVKAANNALNLHYTGKETVPLDATVSDEHRNAAHRMHMGLSFKVKVEILSNGDKRVSVVKVDE